MTERRPNKLAQQLARVTKSTEAAGDGGAERPDVQRDDRAAAVPRRQRPRTAGGRKPAAGESWDERVKRATFYVDRDLLDALDACCDEHGLNKSEFVREAIVRHLTTYR